VRFTIAAALVSKLIEARDEKHLRRFQNIDVPWYDSGKWQ
jgi:hypothetical protein